MSDKAIQNPVALNYAEALFNLARRKGALDKLAADAGLALSYPVLGGKRLRLFLEGPQIPTAAKLDLARKVFGGQVDQILVDLMCLLVERDRISLWRDIFAIFLEKVAEDKGVFQGQVTTAAELDGERRNRLTAALQEFTGKLLQVDFRVDPGILGGVVFKQKDTLVDCSVAGRFAEIKRRLEGVRVV
jgi:F-type H+-transporting ATPase subunit delta